MGRLGALNKKPAESKQQLDSEFRIYVGNLSRKVDSHRLRCFFSKHGKVADARVMHDKQTGLSRGSGFVTMATTIDDEPSGVVASFNCQVVARPICCGQVLANTVNYNPIMLHNQQLFLG